MKPDRAWEWYGQNAPYFGVLSHPEYHAAGAEGAARDSFFASGEGDVAWAFTMLREDFGVLPPPTHALDFGCGVGRLSMALARRAARITGVDVSEAMVAEARRNAATLGHANATFLHAPAGVPDTVRDVDFLISLIVFQHIPYAAGLRLFQQAVGRLAPGGCGIVELPLAQPWRARFEHRKGIVIESLRRRLGVLMGRTVGPPVMEMNAYDVDAALGVLREAGCSRVVVRFKHHGPFQAVVLSFRRDS